MLHYPSLTAETSQPHANKLNTNTDVANATQTAGPVSPTPLLLLNTTTSSTSISALPTQRSIEDSAALSPTILVASKTHRISCSELEKIDETKPLSENSSSMLQATSSESPVKIADDKLREKCDSVCSLSSSDEGVISPAFPSPTTPTHVKCLADLLPDKKDFADKSEYFRNVVVAVDQLYPDTKWPLHNTWTFWHIKNDPNQSWEDNIKEVVDVAYVEDFWSVASHLYTPSNICAHGDITFFKKGIRPMWEDISNKNGGSWLHTIHQYKKYPEIYDHWLETLVCLIGDNFCGRTFLPANSEHSHEHICDFISGVYASPRAKQHRLALWTKNYKDEKTTRLIG